ncbi:MAG TPA: GIY-YIG nuclease family protein [Tepidisphaeraceae bacterium]|jgi:putative endonuclease|nr:GIY-YIG nuclease family protein [Tepidisphaeraceae bacterium]
MKRYDVYILASPSRVLYVGVTSDLAGRMHQHRNRLVPGFTARYGVTRLVFRETFGDVTQAIDWEKKIKGWRREKKVKLIESVNPEWRDLYDDSTEGGPGPSLTVAIPRVATAPLGMTTGAGGDVLDGPPMTLRDPLHPIRRILG